MAKGLRVEITIPVHFSITQRNWVKLKNLFPTKESTVGSENKGIKQQKFLITVCAKGICCQFVTDWGMQEDTTYLTDIGKKLLFENN